jgi:hypothetical protein
MTDGAPTDEQMHDWFPKWIGYYRGPNHHYVCPVPSVVIRWRRRVKSLEGK